MKRALQEKEPAWVKSSRPEKALRELAAPYSESRVGSGKDQEMRLKLGPSPV